MKQLLLLLLISTFSFSTEMATLNLTVSNIQNPEGAILIAIYGENGKFGETEGVVRKVRIPSKVGIVDTVITIEEGTYAIAVLHDLNGNKKMDTGFMGIPKEAYGCSNNNMSLLGIPKHSKSLFQLKTQEPKSMNIKLTD